MSARSQSARSGKSRTRSVNVGDARGPGPVQRGDAVRGRRRPRPPARRTSRRRTRPAGPAGWFPRPTPARPIARTDGRTPCRGMDAQASRPGGPSVPARLRARPGPAPARLRPVGRLAGVSGAKSGDGECETTARLGSEDPPEVMNRGPRPATQHDARDPRPCQPTESRPPVSSPEQPQEKGSARAAPAALPAAAGRPGAGPGSRRLAAASARTARPQRAARRRTRAPGRRRGAPPGAPPDSRPRGANQPPPGWSRPRASPDPDGRCGPRSRLCASGPGRPGPRPAEPDRAARRRQQLPPGHLPGDLLPGRGHRGVLVRDNRDAAGAARGHHAPARARSPGSCSVSSEPCSARCCWSCLRRSGRS